jgi:hypothetical protein
MNCSVVVAAWVQQRCAAVADKAMPSLFALFNEAVSFTKSK